MKTAIVNYRACMARNLVMVKLRVFMATVFRRYEFVLENPSEQVSDR